MKIEKIDAKIDLKFKKVCVLQRKHELSNAIIPTTTTIQNLP